jgi:hypothetical protein
MNREERIIGRVASKSLESWQMMDISKVLRREQNLRGKIADAIRDIKTWMADIRHDNTMKMAAEEAMSALVGALKATDILIGISLGEMHGEMTYLAGEKTAANNWMNIIHMRRDLDDMVAQAKMWVRSEKDATSDGGFSNVKHYESVVSALAECSDKLRKVEHIT